jgi:oxygen-independent coproporphyrinogen-3 oxidase
VANNQQYIQSLQQKKIPFEQELLTSAQQLNEYIMTSLRLMEGCNLEWVKEKFGTDKMMQLQREAERFTHLHWIKDENNHLVLTNEGKLFADRIAGDLFF